MFKCQYPNCDYKTENRWQIHHHHIMPKEMGGTDNDWNLIWLCPTHHSKIYIPESKSGIHKNKGKDSIQLIAWRNGGMILEYIEDGETKFYINK